MASIASVRRLISGILNVESLRQMNRSLLACEVAPEYYCPCCGYTGKFRSFGIMNRPGAECRMCGSLERHRLLKLAAEANFISFQGRTVLHFAPEAIITALITKQEPSRYQTGDIVPGRAMKVLNIEAINERDKEYDVIIACHVLEHVDDRKALSELYRILKPGGQLVVLVPIVEGWSKTYEDSTITSEAGRIRHFGQGDHIRYFGSDFRFRLAQVGFTVREFTADGAAAAKFGLMRGEKVFLAAKPGGQS